MEITKMLTLSTIHITKETAEKLNYELNNNVMYLVVYAKEDCGWYVYIPEELTLYPEDYEDVPDDLMKLLLFARDMDCGILCLDCDGEVLDYLEKFYW